MNAKTSNLVSAIKAASFEQNGTNSNNVDLMDPGTVLLKCFILIRNP